MCKVLNDTVEVRCISNVYSPRSYNGSQAQLVPEALHIRSERERDCQPTWSRDYNRQSAAVAVRILLASRFPVIFLRI